MPEIEARQSGLRKGDGWTYWQLPADPGVDLYEAWRDQITHSYRSDVDTPRAHAFTAEHRYNMVGRVLIGVIQSTEMRLVRTRRNVAQNGELAHTLVMMTSGEGRYAQNGVSLVLQPGELALVDMSLPMVSEFTENCRRVHVMISCADAAELGLSEARRGLSRIQCGDAGAMFRALGRAADRGPTAGRETEAAQQSVVDVLGCSVRPERQRGEALLRTLLFDYLERNFRDCDLTPAAAADYLGVSVRSVHKYFGDNGPTFVEWLINRRLDACYGDLAEVSGRGWRILDVAMGNGFKDVTHFNRVFKRRFGMTPSDLLAGCGRGPELALLGLT